MILLLWLLQAVDPLPSRARPVFAEDGSSGAIDPSRWYVLRKKCRELR